jgi:hypothetical protein
MTFRITALPAAPFAPLFAMSDAALASLGARRVVADAGHGFPCRISLADAELGETLILTHFEHHPVATPFRASHAIYVRAAAAEARPAPGEVPPMLRSRLLSLRGFDAEGMLRAAEVADGTALEPAIETMLADRTIAYLHLHFARPGCYAARVERALVDAEAPR